MQDTAPVSGTSSRRRKGRRFDPRDLWRAYELDRLMGEVWAQSALAAADAEPGIAAALPPADLDLWLSPRERADLELEARFLAALEALPAYEELGGNAWRTSRAAEANTFAARFAHPGEDDELAAWLSDETGELRSQACAAVEKDYQQTHDIQRHWLRDLKASGAYDALVC